MKPMWKSVAMAGLVMALVAPALGEDSKGEVQEIIIKIQTPEGPRWYSLGTDLSKIDIRKGAIVRFNYEEDVIESIEIEEVTPDGQPAAKQ